MDGVNGTHAPLWVAIRDILTSANASIVLIFLLVIVYMVSRAIKNGTINLHTGFLDVGRAVENDRRIIQEIQIKQRQWLGLFIEDKYIELEKYPENDEYHTRYVLQKMFNEVTAWILYNHMTTNRDYVEMKQDLMWRLIKGLTAADVYHGDEFKEYVYRNTETVIKHLVRIKEQYSKRQ